LLFRVAEEWLRELVSRNEKDIQGIPGVWNRIHFCIYRHLAGIHSQPELTSLVFIHLRPDPEYKSTPLFKLKQAYSNQLVVLVQQGIDQGEFRSNISPGLVRDLIFGCLEHHTWGYLRKDSEFDPVTLTDEVMDLLKSGLSARQPTNDFVDSVARLESLVDKIRSDIPGKSGS